MSKRIIIVGPGGSGKDVLRKRLEKKGFKHSVSCTSRPMRDGEVDGIDYHFKDESYFLNNRDQFIEMEIFNGWYYGTRNGDFLKSDVLVITPGGVKSLPKDVIESSFIIYINPDEEIRRERLEMRKDADSSERRIQADKKDFLEFDIFDLQIKNEDF
jgi:guanylate kinase